MSTSSGNASTPVRIGILSTAAVTRHLLKVVADMKSPRVAEFVAVSSRSADKAAEFAAKHGIPSSYGTHEELLRDAQVDAVYIPLPNAVHTEYILEALEHGKHVLCEKPLCLSAADAHRISVVQAAQSERFQKRLVVFEAFMCLYTAQTALVKEMVQSRRLGAVLYMSSINQYPLSRDSHRSEPTSAGGGSLWDVGIYGIALAQYLLLSDAEDGRVGNRGEASNGVGRAVWKEAKGGDGRVYDESFAGTLLLLPAEPETASPSSPGVVASRPVLVQIVSSFAAPEPFTRFEIQCELGRIELANPFKASREDAIVVRSCTTNGENHTAAAAVPQVYTEERVRPPADKVFDHPYEGELHAFCELVRNADNNAKGDAAAQQCFTGPAFAERYLSVVEQLIASAMPN